jgi:amino acid adenylation domain-containing protein
MAEVLDIFTKYREMGIVISLDKTSSNLSLKGDLKSLSGDDKNELLAEKSNLIEFLRQQRAAVLKIPKYTGVEDHIPLTPNQRSIWVHDRLDPVNSPYTIPGLFFFDIANLDKDRLIQAVNECVEDNCALRFVFDDEEGEPYQKEQEVDVKDHIHFISNLDKGQLTKFIESELKLNFDIQNTPPWKIYVCELGGGKYQIVLKIHHLIADGDTLQLIINKVFQNYSGQLNNSQEDVIDYVDYAYWINNREHFHEAPKFWQEELYGYEGDSLFQNSLSSLSETGVGRFEMDIVDALALEVQRFAVKNNLTITAVYTFVYTFIIGMMERTNDLIVGVPTNGRKMEELRNVIGDFVNTLPLRVKLDQTESILTSLNSIQKTFYRVLEHEMYPLEYILEDINFVRRSAESSLFNTMISFPNNQKVENQESEIDHVTTSAMYDLTCTVLSLKETTRLHFDFDTSKLRTEEVSMLGRGMQLILKQVVDTPNKLLSKINLVDTHEERSLLNYNKSGINYESSHFLDQFQKSVHQYSNRPAIDFHGEKWSYNELERSANQLAHCLTNERNVQRGDRVAICINRDPWVVISMLAIFKCGASYVPIDPTYPEKRVAYLIKDSDCEVHIDAEFVREFKLIQDQFGEVYEGAHSPDEVAYVMYTSGTSGLPKGVKISQEALSDYIETAKAYFNIQPNDRIIQQSSISFDVSVEEIFVALSSGAELYILKDGARDLDEMIKCISENEVSVLSTTPLVINELNNNPEALKSIRVLISGGDELKKEYLTNLFGEMSIYNTYGPTESTVCATYQKVSSLNETNVIGTPIQNRSIFIVDDEMRLVPQGVAGEICIGGKGLALGYHGKPELSQLKFVESPFEDGGRIYKTGDLGKWNNEGKIEFLGRNDEQVKIRGFRIELSEIEKAILKFGFVRDTIVLAYEKPEGDKYLVAFVASEEPVDISELKHFIQTSLPNYMCPHHFVSLQKLPRTVNGKIDRNQLKNLEVQTYKADERIQARNETDELLIQVWEDVLQCEKIGIEDNFFELGGHSLKAYRLVHQINEKFRSSMGVSEIFKHPTIEEISDILSNSRSGTLTTYQDEIIYPKPLKYKCSLRQARAIAVMEKINDFSVNNLPVAFEVKGDFDIDKFQDALQKTTEKHEALRTIFVQEGDQWYSKVQQHDSPTFHSIEADSVDILNELSSDQLYLNGDPLFKSLLIHVNDKKYLLLLFSHLVVDGSSSQLVLRELSKHYFGEISDDDQDKTISFGQYITWLNDGRSEIRMKQFEYWSNKLKDGIRRMNPPYDKQRSENASVKSLTDTVIIQGDEYRMLQRKIAQWQITEGTFVVGIIGRALQSWSLNEDVMLGIQTDGRSSELFRGVVGFMINYFLLQVDFEKKSLKEFYRQLNIHLGEGYENQDLSVFELIDRLGLKKGANQLSFLDAIISINTSIFTKDEVNELENWISPVGVGKKYLKPDIGFTVDVSSEFGYITIATSVKDELFEQSSLLKLNELITDEIHKINGNSDQYS